MSRVLALFFALCCALASGTVICPVKLAAFADTPNTHWDNPSLDRVRLAAAVAHQNQVRAKEGLLELLAEAGPRQKRHNTTQFHADVVDGITDDPTVGAFFVKGNTLFRAHHNDLFSLNYVYEFEGPRLVKTQPFGEWFLERFAKELEITFYRKMTPQELEIWKKGDFTKLGRDWGHGAPVVHLSTDKTFTSAAGPNTNPTIGIKVPRDKMLAWAKAGKVWSAVIDQETMTSEFLLTPAQLKELSDAKQLDVILP